MCPFKAFVVALLAFLLYYVVFVGKKQYNADDVKGLSVVVTGASSGLGEQVAYKFASLGAKLFITARTEAKLKKVVEKCMELGSPEAYYVAASQYSYKNASLVIIEALKKLGGIDILVLNHIGQSYHGSYKYNVQDVEKLMMSNMLTHAHMSDLSMPSLSKRNGRIAVISSGADIAGALFFLPYATTKCALNGFFTSLRHELLYNKTDVSVSLFHLGYIDTKLVEKSIKYTNFEVSTKIDMADEIVRGTMARASNVYFPKYFYYYAILNAVMPDSVGAYMRSQFRMPDHHIQL